MMTAEKAKQLAEDYYPFFTWYQVAELTGPSVESSTFIVSSIKLFKGRILLFMVDDKGYDIYDLIESEDFSFGVKERPI